MRFPQLKPRLRTAMASVAPRISESSFLQKKLERVGVTLRFAAGERIFSEGFHPDRVYRIVSGFVRLCMRDRESEPIADFMLPGNWLGLLDRDEYAFSAEAASDVVLRCYLKRETQFFFANAYGATIVEEAKRQIAATVGYRTALAGQAPEERLTSFLRRLSQRLQIPPGEPLELPFSTIDIARHLGLTVESVCRELDVLRRAHAPVISRDEKVLTPQQDVTVQLATVESGAVLDCNHSPAFS